MKKNEVLYKNQKWGDKEDKMIFAVHLQIKLITVPLIQESLKKHSLEKKKNLHVLIMKWLFETSTESGVMNINPALKIQIWKRVLPDIEEKNCQFTVCQFENKYVN